MKRRPRFALHRVPSSSFLHLCWIAAVLLALAGPFGTAAGATRADDTLRIGIFPRRPAASARAMFEPLRQYLAGRLGVPVTLELPTDYASFWTAIEQNRYDLVHYNQYQYIRARHLFGHRIVAKNEELGESQLKAVIFVRRDSSYRTLTDLRGRKILFGGDESAFISYILPTEILRQSGLKPGDYIEQFAQNPPKAIIALYYRQGDAAAAGNVVPMLPLVRKSIDADKVRSLAQSIAVPHLPWAVSDRVDAEQRTAIHDALLSLNDSASGRAILNGMDMTGIRPATDREYDAVRDVTRSVLGENY